MSDELVRDLTSSLDAIQREVEKLEQRVHDAANQLADLVSGAEGSVPVADLAQVYELLTGRELANGGGSR